MRSIEQVLYKNYMTKKKSASTKLGAVPTIKTPKIATSAVVSKNGEVIRTYSEEKHGENFAELANEFASKEAGRAVEFK